MISLSNVQHPSLAIVKGAGLIMQALIDEAEPAVGESMQALSLAEGALPQHLINACFARNNDQRSLAFRLFCRYHRVIMTMNLQAA